MTSHLAAAELTASGKRQTQMDRCLAVVQHSPGLTAKHYGVLTGLGHVETQRRLSDLSRLGQISKGNPPVLWRPAPGHLVADPATGGVVLMPGWVGTDRRVLANIKRGNADRIRERAPAEVAYWQARLAEPCDDLMRESRLKKLKWWKSRLPKEGV